MANNEFINRLKLIELLKKYTDEDYPLTQAKLRQIPGATDIMGYKNTFTRRLFDIADAYNTDEFGKPLNKEDWKIVYDGYENRIKRPGTPGLHNRGIYYNHKLSYNGLNALLHMIEESIQLTSDEKKYLIDDVLKSLTSERIYNLLIDDQFYLPVIETIQSDSYYAKINNNIKVIKECMHDNMLMEFYLATINQDGSYEKSTGKYYVHPYQITYHEGYYWLMGCCVKAFVKMDNKFADKINEDRMFRIDRMIEAGIMRTPNPTYSYFDHRIYSRPSKQTKRKSYISNIKYGQPDYKYVSFIQNRSCLAINTFFIKIHWQDDHHDYSFINDTFPSLYQVKDEIVTINTSLDYFVNWVMKYIYFVEIIGDDELSLQAKDIIKDRLNKAIQINI